MITKLTPKQEEELVKYKEAGIKTALSTERINQKKAKEFTENFYKNILKKDKPKVVFVKSPLTAYYTTLSLYALNNKKDSAFDSAVRSAVLSAVGSAFDSAVRSAVDSAFDSAVYRAVYSAVLSAVGSAFDSAVRSAFDSAFDSAVGSAFDSAVGSANLIIPYAEGQVDSYIFSYYDYYFDILKVTVPEEIKINYEIWKESQQFGWIYPIDNYCIISDRPTSICLNKLGQTHNEYGVAINYSDELKIYALNGVVVPKYLVETNWNKLDCQMLIKEKNAEIRREFVRKAGIEKVCKDLGAKVIEKGFDHKGQPCELLTLNLNDGRERPYIKLLNPSIGTFHIEGVPPDCKTLEQAFNFRNGTKEKPIVLT
jgi:hypothetical protein